MTITEKAHKKVEQTTDWIKENPEEAGNLGLFAFGALFVFSVWASGYALGSKAATRNLAKVPGVLDAISHAPNPAKLLRI